MIALKKVLVATDFSEPSGAALAYGRELAHNFGAQLILLHVTESMMTAAMTPDAYIGFDVNAQRQLESWDLAQLEGLLDDAARRDLRAKTVLLKGTAPAVAIVDYARDNAVDLIVLGTHGRGAVAHLLMGSVAERVVRTAPCPVLTVRHPEREFVLPDAVATEAKA